MPPFRYRNGAYPRPALLCLENSHNLSGGTVGGPTQIKTISEIAKEVVPNVHLDGARIWNAAVATGASPKELVESVDTVTISLDKALCAPYGALLCGQAATIEKAWRWRRMLGGFIREASVMAVAGIYALENMVDRVLEDNQRAADIADRLISLQGLEIDPSSPFKQTTVRGSGQGIGGAKLRRACAVHAPKNEEAPSLWMGAERSH